MWNLAIFISWLPVLIILGFLGLLFLMVGLSMAQSTHVVKRFKTYASSRPKTALCLIALMLLLGPVTLFIGIVVFFTAIRIRA